MKITSQQLTVATCFFAASVCAAQYPRLDVSPATPTTADSVTVRLILGVAAVNCMPVFTGTCTVTPDTAPTYPPRTEMRLQYTASTPSRTVACSDSIVEYGPSWELGLMPFGRYTVLRGIINDTVGSFDVAHAGVGHVVGGMVTDYSRYGKPLPGASVYLSAADTIGDSVAYEVIDSSTMAGYYEVRAPQAGDYRLMFSAESYRSRAVNLTVSRDTIVHQKLMSDTATGGLRIWISGAIGSYVAGCSVTVVALDSAGETIVDSEKTGVTGSWGQLSISAIPLTNYGQMVRVSAHWLGVACAGATVPLWEGHSPVYLNWDCPTGLSTTSTVVLRDNLRHILSAGQYIYFGDTMPIIQYVVHNPTSATVSLHFDRFCLCTADGDQNCSFGFVAITPEGDTVAGVGPSIINCESLRWQTMLAPGEHIYMRSIIRPVSSTADTATIYAWLYGEQPDPALHVGIRLASGTGVRSAITASDGRPATSVSVAAGRVRVVLARPAVVSIAVLGLDGRVVRRMARAAPYPAGTHEFRVPGDGAGVRVVRLTADSQILTLLVRGGER